MNLENIRQNAKEVFERLNDAHKKADELAKKNFPGFDRLWEDIHSARYLAGTLLDQINIQKSSQNVGVQNAQ
jgi:hypothetical protein